MDSCCYLKAVVLEWAGTTIDHGSRAPAIVFQEIFRERGIEITQAQAREPMGMAKREHIAAIGSMNDVARAWQDKYGQPPSDDDFDSMYEDFLPLQKKTLRDHCRLIDGVAEAVRECREMGLKIGSSTGYTRELMEVVSEAAGRQGYEPDCVICAEDAPRGRPAPFLLYEAAMRLDVYPLWSIVKVDDTEVGIQAGRNAGCWTVGVTRTGNCVGLSVEEVNALSDQEQRRLCHEAGETLKASGAHFIVESVTGIPAVLDVIERRAARGELPI